jgi:hypothetical protein
VRNIRSGASWNAFALMARQAKTAEFQVVVAVPRGAVGRGFQ